MKCKDLPDRYARQIALPEIGEAGQARLAAARVLVVGGGGLGAPALLYLAAAGVGTLGIADDDTVETGNLQRQVLYTEDDLGHPKTEAAAERLAALNPCVSLETHRLRVDADNAVELMRRYDVVVDATDRLEGKFLLNDAAARARRPLVYASALGFEAQVAVFDAARGPCLRCLFPEPPEVPALTCSEAGILGAVTGMAGSLQALEAIKWILSGGAAGGALEPLTGRVWVMDARSFQTRVVRLPRDPDCPVCTRPPGEIRLASDPAGVGELEPEALPAHSGALLIDVREPSEWDAGHLPGAMHLPLSRLLEAVPQLPRRERYIAYCAHGIRSQAAARLLADAGYAPAFSLRGGVAAMPADRLVQEEPDTR